jgi:hypothetical protein
VPAGTVSPGDPGCLLSTPATLVLNPGCRLHLRWLHPLGFTRFCVPVCVPPAACNASPPLPLPPGHRHPFLAKYKVGFNSAGQVLAIDLDIYHNAGNSWDLSHSIMDRALGHSDCCYKIPNVRVKGNMCYTHMSSNTAFRGFGGPQVRVGGGGGGGMKAVAGATYWFGHRGRCNTPRQVGALADGRDC